MPVWHLVFGVLSCPEGILWLMHMDQLSRSQNMSCRPSGVPGTAHLGPGQCPSLPWFPPTQTVPGTCLRVGPQQRATLSDGRGLTGNLKDLWPGLLVTGGKGR